jgi:hypothetical protein
MTEEKALEVAIALSQNLISFQVMIDSSFVKAKQDNTTC